MATVWHKLQTNIPVVGTPKYADLAEGNFGPQLKLTGMWDSLGEGSIGLPHDMALGVLRGLGVITGDPIVKERDDGTEWVRYKVTSKKIKILRTEDGKKKMTDITLADGSSPPKSAAPSTNGKAAPQTQRQVEDPKERLERLHVTYNQCFLYAKEVFGSTCPLEVVQSAAATLFIQAAKDGCLLPLPPKAVTKAQIARIEELCRELNLGQEELDKGCIWASKGLAKDPRELNDQQAATLIDLMEKKLVQKKADAARKAEEERKRKEEEEARRLAQQQQTAAVGYDEPDVGESIPF